MGAHTRIISLIAQERQRQIDLGYDAAHDAQHGVETLARAAFAYMVPLSQSEVVNRIFLLGGGWPVGRSFSRRVDMIRAAAMLVAAIECGDRQEPEGWR